RKNERVMIAFPVLLDQVDSNLSIQQQLFQSGFGLVTVGLPDLRAINAVQQNSHWTFACIDLKRDRKNTRLNFSHLKISPSLCHSTSETVLPYGALFCSTLKTSA